MQWLCFSLTSWFLTAALLVHTMLQGGTNAVGGGNLGIVAGAGACSALPAAPAASSLMAPSRPKSFMGGAVSSNMQGSTGLLVREGPDGRGGITRHLQPSAINVVGWLPPVSPLQFDCYSN